MDDDIAAVATALAPAALSVIRTTGKHCTEKIASLFSRPEKLLSAAGYTTVHGWLIENGSKIDEVVLSVYKAPHSFTGEDSIEITCHGGVSITVSILKLLLQSGFRQAERGEFTFRSFINGKNDLTKAEAIKEIIDAKTPAASKKAVTRLSGNLLEQLLDVKKMLLQQIAAIQVTIEYPEDETSEPDTVDLSLAEKALNLLESFIAQWQTERLFTDGAKVVLAGRTNAGKSRLFNTLVQEERSIVSNIAGTTRDYLDADLNCKGMPIKLFDTAGFRYVIDEIEKSGIERTKQLTSTADLVLYLVDGTAPCDKTDRQFFLADVIVPKILVRTKLDLCDAERQQNLLRENAGLIEQGAVKKAVCISAAANTGIDTLLDAIFSSLVSNQSSSENITVGNERQKNAVEKALHFLRHAVDGASNNMPCDAMVLDLEEALNYVGEITGEVKSDDILAEIFSGFCVGK